MVGWSYFSDTLDAKFILALIHMVNGIRVLGFPHINILVNTLKVDDQKLCACEGGCVMNRCSESDDTLDATFILALIHMVDGIRVLGFPPINMLVSTVKVDDHKPGACTGVGNMCGCIYTSTCSDILEIHHRVPLH